MLSGESGKVQSLICSSVLSNRTLNELWQDLEFLDEIGFEEVNVHFCLLFYIFFAGRCCRHLSALHSNSSDSALPKADLSRTTDTSTNMQSMSHLSCCRLSRKIIKLECSPDMNIFKRLFLDSIWAVFSNESNFYWIWGWQNIVENLSFLFFSFCCWSYFL